MEEARVTLRGTKVYYEEKPGVTWRRRDSYELEAVARPLLGLYLSKFAEETHNVRGSDARRFSVTFSREVFKVAITELTEDAKRFTRLIILSDTPEAFAGTAALR